MTKFVSDQLGAAANHSVPAAIPGYAAMLKELRSRSNPPSLWRMLLSLGRSASLTMVSGNPVLHQQLIHLIFKLDSFTPPAEKKKKSADKSPVRPDSPSKSAVATAQEAAAAAAAAAAATPPPSPLFDDFSIATAHLNLATNLLSSNSTFLPPYIAMIIRLLMASPPDATRRIEMLHKTLAYACILVPKATDELRTLLPTTAPYKRAATEIQKHFTAQLLHITTYVPSLTSTVVGLILMKCTEIDVEIRIHDGGSVSVMEELEEHDEMFEIDEFGGETDRALAAKLLRARAMSIEADDYADKLDELLLLLFTFFKESPVAPRDHYDLVREAFDSIVLTTHKSKFTQFVMLQLCGLDADERERQEKNSLVLNETPLCDTFVSHLLGATLLTSHPNVHRQSAACYLASFVARTSFTNVTTVAEVVSTLLWWCADYISSRRSSSTTTTTTAATGGPMSPLNRPGSPKSTDHTLFYTISQATFYIMCFRGTAVIQWWNLGVSEGRDMGEVDLDKSRWATLCCHRYKPLKHCLESVRKEFLHLSTLFDLLSADEISGIEQGIDGNFSLNGDPSASRNRPASPIQTNATLEAKRRKGGVGGLGKGSNPLDSFFPYDPFLLRRSHPLVGKYYRNWEGSLARALEQAQYVEGKDADEDLDSGDEDSDDGALDSDLEGGSDSDSDDDDDGTHDGDVSDHMPASNDSGNGFAPMSISYGTGRGGAWMNALEAGGEDVVIGEEGGDGVLASGGKTKERRRKRADSIASHGSW
jgi:RNA polymerase I-specific transcription initiation factor RRN3